LRDKGGRCVWLTNLPTSCADCLEIWKPLKPLEHSGSDQACTGIALPLLSYWESHSYGVKWHTDDDDDDDGDDDDDDDDNNNNNNNNNNWRRLKSSEISEALCPGHTSNEVNDRIIVRAILQNKSTADTLLRS